MLRRLIAVLVLLGALFLLAGCQQLDVIGNTSVAGFEQMLKALPSPVLADAQAGYWVLTAGDSSVQLAWSQRFTQEVPYDAFLTFDAQPFVDAGLDEQKLPQGMLQGGVITLGTKFAGSLYQAGEAGTPQGAYQQIVQHDPARIGYHAAMAHFGIDLGNGNMFEWAKDMASNDKDMVFVLNPQPFIDAGVDPTQVAGWVYAPVETMDAKGAMVTVDKFLKPFDLK